MSRVKVWIEAYEEFVISKGFKTRKTTSKMSDDEISTYAFSIVKKKHLQEEFDKFVHEWCMRYK